MIRLRTGGGAQAQILAAIVAALGWACGGPPPARTHAIDIQNASYAPDSVVVAQGDTVVWTNRDIVPHTVSAGDVESGPVGAGGRFAWIARTAGVHRYQCAYHPSMTAVIVTR